MKYISYYLRYSTTFIDIEPENDYYNRFLAIIISNILTAPARFKVSGY